MNEQQRNEIAELVLRAFRLNYDSGAADATDAIPIHDKIRMSDDAHAAQREVWEALYRIRLNDSGESR